MKAAIGDRIVIGGTRMGGTRLCKVLDVRSEHGPDSYLVRWDDTGEQALLIPGADDLVVLRRLRSRRPVTSRSLRVRSTRSGTLRAPPVAHERDRVRSS